MRAIKFRAKSLKTRKWIFGYYAVLHIAQTDNDRLLGHDEVPSIFNDEPGNRNDNYWKSVDPDTVGQFTGLYDKNHNEIYEGDILKVGDCQQKIEVRFVRGVFAFLWDGNLDDEFPTSSPTHEWAEVIGNIHDNPSRP